MPLTPEERARGRRNFLKAMAGVPPLAALGAAAALRGPIRGGPVRVGFIGPGRQGKVLLGQCQQSFIDVRAICDINPQNREQAADALVTLGWPRPALYENWQEMLAREDIEAVLIATPLWSHAEIALGALASGRHVLVEKMMAYDVDGCRQMADEARRRKLVLEVGYNRFYAPQYQLAYEQVIKRGVIGDIHHVRLMYHRSRSWRRDLAPPSPDYTPARWGYPTWDHLANWRLYRKYSQGLVAELGGHQIGTTCQFLGSVPTAALGSGGIYRFKDREVNDHVYVILEFPEGRTVTFSSIESNDFDHITEQFMGTKGTLIFGREGEVMLFTDDDRPTAIETSARAGNAVLEASESRRADARGRTAQNEAASSAGEDRLLPYRLEIAAFCSAIRTGTPLRCGPEMGSAITAACVAANDAIESRTRVPVPTAAAQNENRRPS
jgi:predicted dehydrogenase